MVEPDSRWEWYDAATVTDREPVYIKIRCKHLELHAVESIVTGEPIAQLCATCDAQLPPPVPHAPALPGHG